MATGKPIAAAAPPSVAPFLTKVFDMVDDPSTDATVSWSRAGNSFVIWDHHTFGKDLLPKYFRHNNFSSFVRQLNTYGFHKVDPDRYEFASEGFLRGQKHLLKTIRRRKPPHNTPQQLPQGKPPSVEACIEVGKFGLEEDIAMLKRDKNLLMQELVKLRQHHQNSNLQIHNVTRRIRDMERNQQQMLSFLAIVVQSPGFLSQLVQQNGNIRWKPEASKKRRFPAIEQGAVDVVESPDGQIVKYQPILTEMPSPDLGTVMDTDVGDLRPKQGDTNDGDAMSDGEDPWSSAVDDFSMPDFSDFDLDQLLASPLPETNAEIEAAIPDFIKDLGFPAQETKMEISENGSFN